MHLILTAALWLVTVIIPVAHMQKWRHRKVVLIVTHLGSDRAARIRAHALNPGSTPCRLKYALVNAHPSILCKYVSTGETEVNKDKITPCCALLHAKAHGNSNDRSLICHSPIMRGLHVFSLAACPFPPVMSAAGVVALH